MANKISVTIVAFLCILIALIAILFIYHGVETDSKDNLTIVRSYRLVYTIELNSSGSREINLNWTVLRNHVNFQVVRLLNFSINPSWMKTDENGNTIAHFSVNLSEGGNLNISMTALISINSTNYQSLSESTQYDTNSAIFKTYTQPEKFIESDNPIIINMVHNITQGYSNPITRSQAICTWVHQNIEYSNFSETPHGAIWALENRTGDCSEYAFLFAALCRADNIPARVIDGIVTWNINSTSWGNKNWTDIGHDWAEVYLPSQGWVWVDPESGQYGCSDGEHIAIQTGHYCASLNGGYRYSFTGNVNIAEHFEIFPEG
jgi:hypothetical protein